MSLCQSWTTGSIEGRGGWCMNAATMIMEIALRWIAVMAAFVYRAFPVRYCADGLQWRCCR